MHKKFARVLQAHPLLPACLTTGWNLLYALLNGVLGIQNQSYWFSAMFAYHAILGTMRFVTLTRGRRSRQSGCTVMTLTGVVMLLLAVTLAGITALTIIERRTTAFHEIVVIAAATYTFTAVGWTITSTVKAHRQPEPLTMTLRNISCASAVGSMLTLERTMLSTFGDVSSPASQTMLILSGAGGFLLVIAIGTGMVIQSKKMRT